MAQPQSTESPPGSKRLVIIAAAVALLAVVFVNLYVMRVKAQAHQGEFTVYKLVTTLKPGEKLSRKDVNPVLMPKRYLDSFDDAVREESADGDDALTAVVGTRLMLPGRRNQFLTYDLFADSQTTDLDTRITQNLRLIALPVNPRTLPGSLRPGMFVDIEAQFPGGELNVLPVMERVEVFSVGARSIADDPKNPGRSQRNFTTISIQVGPGEATSLEKIKKLVIGDFELHLRNPTDTGTPKIPEGGINPKVLGLINR